MDRVVRKKASNFVFRVGRPEDLKAIDSIYCKYKPKSLLVSGTFLASVAMGLKKELPFLVLVAEKGKGKDKGKVVGFYYQNFSKSKGKHSVARDSLSVVHGAFQGQGIGRELFKRNLLAIESAAGKKYKPNFVGETDRGSSLVESFGFKQIATSEEGKPAYGKKVFGSKKIWTELKSDFKARLSKAGLKGSEDPDAGSLSIDKRNLLHELGIVRHALQIKSISLKKEIPWNFFELKE